ncbi:MAG: lipopolysaccharide kinase InaA family protein [Phycisphaerae bacterium]
MGDQDVYLKHFHNPSPWRRLVQRLVPSHAWSELTNSRQLRASGIETPEVLAAQCNHGAEWLATAAIAPARQGDLWHIEQAAAGEQGRRNITQAGLALAEMIGKMHRAGWVQNDLHGGNILIRTDGPHPRPVMMDLHRVRHYRRISRRRMAANLAQLYHDRLRLTTRTERLRFLKHYLRVCQPGGTLRGWNNQVELLGRRHSRRRFASRDRRTLRQDRYFARLKLPRLWRGHVVLATKNRLACSQAAGIEFKAQDWRQVLAEPEALFRGSDVEVIKDSPSSLVIRRTLCVGPHRLRVVIKRARRKQRWKWVLDCFRPSRPVRAFELGHALLTRRIPTALPLAALERRWGPHLMDAILICEALDATAMNKFLDSHLARPPRGEIALSVPQQRRLAQQVLGRLGRLVQLLHDHNFAHRDLKASNLLIRWTPPREPEVVLVDLDGLSRRRFMTSRCRFQSLMRLNVSLLECPVVNRAGRLRMLMGYLRRPGSGQIEFKVLWRVLDEWSDRKLRKQLRARRHRQKATRRPV